MKAIVEFGERTRKPYGTHAHHICTSLTQAHKLAASMVFIMSCGAEDYTCRPNKFYPSKYEPRIIWRSQCKTKWVCVSKLDGVSRGSFASTLPRVED